MKSIIVSSPDNHNWRQEKLVVENMPRYVIFKNGQLEQRTFIHMAEIISETAFDTTLYNAHDDQQ